MYPTRMPRGRGAKASLYETDADIVAGCLRGEDRAWDALLDRYASYVYAVAIRAFGLGPQAADEVFQDVCVRLYDGLPGFSGRGEFRAWLRAVVVSACRDHLRKEGKRALETTEPREEDAIDALETALVVRSAVAALGEPCATTMSLHFFGDLTQAEVATRLGVPSGTVAARISRCLRRLRDSLQEPAGRRASRG
jgi:RNA polymerase sigma-70 factor, ECF subfamily